MAVATVLVVFVLGVSWAWWQSPSFLSLVSPLGCYFRCRFLLLLVTVVLFLWIRVVVVAVYVAVVSVLVVFFVPVPWGW